MAYNHEYPYVDPNRYNSDWELNEVKALRNEMNTFEAMNKISFSGEWDITKQYPAWTIVNTNNGQEGYISIQPVPSGITIDNTDYWVSVVNYTATIADLQNRVVALEGEMADVPDTITEANAKLPTWSLDSMKDKTVILIADSWGVTQSGAGGVNNWIDLLTPYFKTVYASAGGGYSFNKSGASFITLLNNLVIPAGTQIDAIIAIGGANTTAAGDVTAFVNACKSAYPDSLIVLGANGPCESMSNNWQTQERVRAEGAAGGCLIIDGLWQNTLKEDLSNWTSDKYHLKDLTRFVKNIVSYLITGSFAYTYNKSGNGLELTWTAETFAEYYKDVSFQTYSREKERIMFSLVCSKSTNYNAAPGSYEFTADQVASGIDLGTIGITGAFPFYYNTQANLRHHMYVLYENAYYRFGLYNPSMDPYAHLFVLPKATGTYTKAQLFPETFVAYVGRECDMFDFKGFRDVSEPENTMLAFTRTQLITI